jgi:hypothetical protein
MGKGRERGQRVRTYYVAEQVADMKRKLELEKQASNIYTIHPKKSDLILLYEVVDGNGDTEWGGENAEHCIQWLSLAPNNSRVLVSAWDSDEEDAHLVGQTLDITAIVRAASL